MNRYHILGATVAMLAVTTSLTAQGAAKSGTDAKPAATAEEPRTTAVRDFSKWVKPSDSFLQVSLSPLQYSVTQHEDTEMPFKNTYWANHEAGIYVDVVSGEPLFSSKDKYESGTGWPSFTRPLEPRNIKLDTDRKLGYERNEVRSAHADSHLGHVFNDGPKPTGLRYCMNSAAMRFVPVDKLMAEGYGQYLKLFK